MSTSTMIEIEPPLTAAQLVPMLARAKSLPDLEAALRCVRVHPDKMTEALARFDFSVPEAEDQAIRWALAESGVSAPVADEYVAALHRFCAMKHENPEERCKREAAERAQYLMATLGADHPETILAVVRSMELAEPGALDKLAKDCGIALPAPSTWTDDGAPLFSSHDIAEALADSEQGGPERTVH